MTYVYHVFVHPRSGVTAEMVDACFSSEIDWYRYWPGHYVVVSTKTAQALFGQIEHLLRAPLLPTLTGLKAPDAPPPGLAVTGTAVVLRVDLAGGVSDAYAGLNTTPFWEWLERQISQKGEN
ncbi:hypothetical protein AYO41_01780 [Verrucomicrobia bacterium SCGC AG-212-E04]|nr:hypothetical protein AYO41_01780 [Verrucomicrobia bacterium SCGC AG-212-E04]